MFEFYEMDLDQDGIPDAVAVDMDGDGTPDALFIDSDGNGTFDTVLADTDNNGTFDTMFLDTDEDGDFDTMFADTEEAGDIGATCIDELRQFDPALADMDAVSGNPEQSMEQWEFQGDTGRCALYSQKFVIEELTDRELDIEELAELAEENGWFSEETGTPLLSMNKLLDYYGIDNKMSFYNGISDIDDCLGAGGKVIVSIDADEIWYGEEDDLFTPGDGANHAVEVIGIDRSDPEEVMVILNDSGNPNGCGEMIPLDTFLDAWEDGGYQMIACM